MIRTIKGAMRSPRYKGQKLFVITDENRGFESVNFENKKRGGEMRSLYNRLKKKNAFHCKKRSKKN